MSTALEDYQIMQLQKKDLPILATWLKQEGLDPGLVDVESIYHAVPMGCFAGKLNNKIIALGSIINYTEQFAFCGYYMIDPEYRNQAYDISFTQTLKQYAGQRSMYIDGPIAMLQCYKRAGFQLAYKHLRYEYTQGIIPAIPCAYIQPVDPLNTPQIIAYDAQYFPAKRASIFNAWCNIPHSINLIYKENEQLMGLAMLRLSYEGMHIGPFYADHADIAEVLLTNLIAASDNTKISIDVPEFNDTAINLLEHYGFQNHGMNLRLYLKQSSILPLQAIYSSNLLAG